MAKKTTSAWSGLQRKSASLRRNVEQLIRDCAHLAGAENADVVSGSTVVKAELAEWKRVLHTAEETTRPINMEMERKASETLETLEERLVRTLRDAGLNVYGEMGLLVVEGVVHVEISVKKPSVRVNGEIATDISIAGLKQLVRDEVDRVRKITTPPEKFIEVLLRAYEAERLHAAKEFGAQLQVSAVFWQATMLKQSPNFRSNPTATNFHGYSREIFRADLYRLLEGNVTNTDGKHFRYASGSDTAGAIFMFVPQLGRTAHIGRIWFERGN
jgi:hypothetical protein